ncbi:hypothetical protein [Geodermatophilus sp. URMC 65]
MRKTLTLSKETLRVLDDDDLARVVGGAGDKDKSANSGSNAKCPGKAKGHDKKKEDHGGY